MKRSISNPSRRLHSRSELLACTEHKAGFGDKPCKLCRAYRLRDRVKRLGFDATMVRGVVRSNAPQPVLQRLHELPNQPGAAFRLKDLQPWHEEQPTAQHRYTFTITIAADLEILADDEEEARESMEFYRQGIYRLTAEQIAPQPYVSRALRKIDGRAV